MFCLGLLFFFAAQFIEFPLPPKELGLEYIKMMRELQDLCGVYELPTRRELAVQKLAKNWQRTSVKPSTTVQFLC